MYPFLAYPLNFRLVYLIAYSVSICGNVTLERTGVVEAKDINFGDIC